jgi:hypothetical protein
MSQQTSSAAGGANLPGAERKLYGRLQPFLIDGEQIRAALVGFVGPAQGIEGLLAPFLGLLGVLFTLRSRKYFSIAATTSGVLILRNSSAHKPRSVVDRLPLTAIESVADGTGELYIVVAGQRYRVEGIWSIELMKIRRFASGPLLRD